MARTPKKRLRTLVSKLKARAVAAAQRVTRRAAPPKRPSPTAAVRGSVKVAAPAKPAPPLKQLSRRSVVRKPARGPSVKTPRAKAPITAAKPHRTAKSRTPSPGTPSAAPTPLVFAAPAAEAPAGNPLRSVEEQFTLPAGYGDHRIVLMVRDPFWLFAYWEIQAEQERAVRGQLLPEEIAGLQTVLRVYEVTGVEDPAPPATRHFDIGLSGLARNWHIHADAPGCMFLVEIGLLTAAGRFLMLARSNRVTTPRSGPSEVIDEAWVSTDEDYGKLFGAAGIGPGSSPGAWSRLVNQQLSSAAAASHGFVGQLQAAQLKDFWCRVDADLVLHGATEPRSRVAVQDQPVAVRKDGTFSVRLALPQGKQTVTVDVTSPNGRHTRTVTPIISLAWAGQPGHGQPSALPQSASDSTP